MKPYVPIIMVGILLMSGLVTATVPKEMPIMDNHPPEAPKIAGPAHGKVGVDYEFYFCATDPDGDNISYLVEWGDGHITDWIGPFPQGNEIMLNHTWDDIRYYLVRCKAKDIYGAESEWSTQNIPISMRYYVSFIGLLHRFPLLQILLEYVENIQI